MIDVKLGVNLWSQASDWPAFLAAGQRVEQLGFDHLWTWDHIYAIFGDPDQPIFEGYTALAALAQATERVRLGLFVGATAAALSAADAAGADAAGADAGGAPDAAALGAELDVPELHAVTTRTTKIARAGTLRCVLIQSSSKRPARGLPGSGRPSATLEMCHTTTYAIECIHSIS